MSALVFIAPDVDVKLRLRLPMRDAGIAQSAQPETEHADREALQRVTALQVRLANLNKQPSSSTAAASEWASACGEGACLLSAACSSDAPWSARACVPLFAAIQLALQTGPLFATKPARFGLLRGWCGGLADHPHAQAAAELLTAAERALAHGIMLSERQASLIARWRHEQQRAFPLDMSTASEGDDDEEEDDDDECAMASFDAMERAMRMAFYPSAAGSSYTPAPPQRPPASIS